MDLSRHRTALSGIEMAKLPHLFIWSGGGYTVDRGKCCVFMTVDGDAAGLGLLSRRQLVGLGDEEW